jgi:endonuclease-3
MSTTGDFKKTGVIWNLEEEERLESVRLVCKKLQEEYGRPRFGNPYEPVDDLIYLILSTRTSMDVTQRTFNSVKQRFEAWEVLLETDATELYSILKPAGLARLKTEQIRGTLRKIRRDFGAVTLDALQPWTLDERLEYLTDLPGVSGKVARCVMLYTFGDGVLPVDTHVHRISRRLGWTNRSRADQCHEELEALVPQDWQYVFHVGAIMHGRKECFVSNPSCADCILHDKCHMFNDGS